MAKVLGLSFFYHDSAAALVRDGQIVAAAAEERFCRRKHTNEFPKQAIEYCLEAAELASINELDAIVFYEKPVLKLQRIVETLVAVWPKGLPIFARRLPTYLTSKFNVYRVIEKTLAGYQGPILFAGHHESHAASAFYLSPFEDAAILTMDGVGEWETTTIGVGRGQEITLDRAIHFPHSIGLLYSALTSYLGFRVNDGEWKVMGLAPYGEPRYVEQFRKLVEVRDDGSFRLDMQYFAHHYSSQWSADNGRWEELFGFPRRDPNTELTDAHQDLARSGQAVVEELILNLAREAKRASGSDNLVIAGGVGLNCVANWRIEREGIFRNVWIQPAAGDDGGALGAAMAVSQQKFGDPRPQPMQHGQWGPQFSGDDIQAFLDTYDIPSEHLDEARLLAAVADLIADGQVVGWFQGRMEFGPRALGGRSILADATRSDMKEVLNRKIKFREFFRPFAPAVPIEDVDKYFDVPPGTELPFMLKTPTVRPEMRERIPAVTHHDGTGRVQTISEAQSPRFWRLLKAVESRTGVPIVVNTSFNVRGEPVVCTPKDAYDCFAQTGLDALVVGDYLIVSKPTLSNIEERGFERSNRLEEGIGAEFEHTAEATAGMSAAVPTAATSVTVTPPARVEDKQEAAAQFENTTATVLDFYREMPFNYYSNAVDTAQQLMRVNRLKEYPVVHRFLQDRPGARVIDVGCGAGWFVNSCAHYYGAKPLGLDLNPIVLRQARSVSRLMTGCEVLQFQAASVFEFDPGEQFDLVNSLGVLHSTPDCPGAIRRILPWVASEGRLHLGLYHYYGRKPFLEHFAKLQARGWSDRQLYDEYRSLNPDVSDETHMQSWFRDQVLHPHETQHTYEELHEILESEGFVIDSTSLNNFGPLPPLQEAIALEKQCEEISIRALNDERRYYPGFFSVWARRA